MKNSRFLWTIFLVVIISSCATYSSKVKVDAAMADYPMEKQLEHRFFLIGDAGLSLDGTPSDALKLFQNAVSKSSKNDMLLFLGGNIDPNGLPEGGAKGRDDAESELNMQLNAAKDAAARVTVM